MTDSGQPIYAISDWTSTFETAKSRGYQSLPWVSVPVALDSNGFVSLVEKFGDRAPAIYGAWVALACIASRCPCRGLLCTSKGVGYTAARMSSLSRFPVSVFEELIEFAADDAVRWLIEIDPSDADVMIKQFQSLQKKNRNGAAQTNFLDEVPPESPPGPLPNVTQPNANGTRRNTTQPNANPAVGGSVGRWEELVSSVDIGASELAEAITRFRDRAQKPPRGQFPGRLIGCVIVASKAAGDGGELERDICDRIRDRSIRKFASYLRAPLERMSGIPGDEALRIVKEKVTLLAEEYGDGTQA